MATIGDLKEVLADLADQAPSARAAGFESAVGLRPPTPLQRQPRRSRRYSAAAASAAAVVAVVGLVVVSSGSPPATRNIPPGGAQLTADRWTALPNAPIPASNAATSVWTGSQFIVWGGEDRRRDTNAGAAYDPTTGTWQRLPASPLSPRGYAASVWTGHQMLIVGGLPVSGLSPLHDGALYDPATRHWRRISPLPHPSGDGGVLVWNGHRAIYASFTSSGNSNAVLVDTYDPATNRWTVLPRLTLARSPDSAGTLMVIEHQIVVWTTRNGAYAFDATAHQWKRSRLSPTRTSYVGKVVRAGTSLLFPGGYYEASGHPTMPPGPGAQYFLRTGASREIAPAVIDLPGTVYVWTGARLLGTYQGAARGFGSKVESGTTAAWNPHTNTWTRLKRSPAITQLGTWAWTGKELIGWGPNTRAGHRYDGMIFGPR